MCVCASLMQALVRGNLICRASSALWLKHAPLPSLPAAQPGRPPHRLFSLGCLCWASHQIFVLLLLPRGRGGGRGGGGVGPPAEPGLPLPRWGAFVYTRDFHEREPHAWWPGQEAEMGEGVKGTDLQFTMDTSWGGSVPRTDYGSEDWCMCESC